jgi:hypothetical protein
MTKQLIFKTTLLLLCLAAVVITAFTGLHKDEAVVIGPGQQPKAIVDQKGILKVVYGSEDKIYYLESRDKAKSFSKPALVASLPGGLMLGMGRGPQIASSDHGTLITAVNKAGDVYAWKLGPGSREWDGPVRINDADTVAKEGFVALARGKGKEFYAVWNDLRSGNNQVYGSVSADGGKSWGKNKLIYSSPDTTICECCKTTLVYDNQDKVYVMWRNQIDGFRDMYLASVKKGGKQISPAVKLGNGTWKLKGCPMDGGSLYSDGQGNVTTAWMRDGEVYLSEPGKEEVLIGKGRTPALTKNARGTVVLWSLKEEILALSPGSENPVSIGKGRYPNVVSGQGYTVAFWETADKEVVTKVLTDNINK